MAYISDRWYRKDGDGGKEPTASHGTKRRWMARYDDPDGAEKTKTFARKVDAQRWLDEVTTDIVTGK